MPTDIPKMPWEVPPTIGQPGPPGAPGAPGEKGEKGEKGEAGGAFSPGKNIKALGAQVLVNVANNNFVILELEIKEEGEYLVFAQALYEFLTEPQFRLTVEGATVFGGQWGADTAAGKKNAVFFTGIPNGKIEVGKKLKLEVKATNIEGKVLPAQVTQGQTNIVAIRIK